FQVGANAGQAIAIDKTVDAKANALGNVKFAADRVATTDAAAATSDGKLSGMVLNGVTISDVSWKAGDTGVDVAKAVAAGINSQMGETGLRATVSGTGGITLESLKADKDVTLTAGTITGGAGTVAVPANATQVGLTGITAVTAAATASSSFVSSLDISSVKGAQQALEVVDKALTSVNSARADLGAVQNRFTSVVANLQTS
ncbi:flagellin, partial [Pseudoxanthomonas mexicana]|uniref:flagellin n=2 Tax=Pseudoxanthomonas TaxID=83618 RepID=UPI000B181374